MTIKLEGLMAQILLNIAPNEYEEFIEIKNGKPVLYATIEKALYGTLQVDILFYKHLSGQLEECGFKINPYDFCVAQKI